MKNWKLFIGAGIISLFLVLVLAVGPAVFDSEIIIPANNSVFVSGQNYWFGINITEESGFSWIQFAGVNYTLTKRYTNATQVFDFTGKNNGSVAGNVTISSSYAKVGTGGAKDYGVFGNYIKIYNSYSNLNISSGLTISQWVKIEVGENSSGGETFVRLANASGSFPYAWAHARDSSNKLKPSFRIQLNASGCDNSAGYDYSINDSNYHHFVGIYNGSAVISYLDGNFGAVNSFSDSCNSLLNNHMNNGAFNRTFILAQSNLGNVLNGSLDEVMIFNRSLSASEVSSLYSNQSLGFRAFDNDASLVAYYSFDTGYSVDILNLSAGTYPYFFGANGTDGSVNTTVTNFYTVQHVYPQFNNSNFTPINNSEYGSTYNFTVTVFNTTGNVWLQINNTNYTARNYSASNYSVNFTGLLVGTFNYFWGAGSVSNGINTTTVSSYTVSSAVYPQFSNIGTSPASGSQFGPSEMWIFNVTMAQNNQTVGISINGTNYSLQNISNVYSYNTSAFLNTPGTNYTVYFWAYRNNGTAYTYNQSSSFVYQVGIAYPIAGQDGGGFVPQPTINQTNSTSQNVTISDQAAYDRFLKFLKEKVHEVPLQVFIVFIIIVAIASVMRKNAK